MTIVCGTDFSENATATVRLAALLAQHSGQPLKVVHVIDELGAELAVSTHTDQVYEPVRKRLIEEASQLQKEFAIEVEPLSPPGHAAQTLAGIASAEHASLLVVSSLGTQKPNRWLLGSVARRVAQKTPVPVLVVRNPAPLEAWLRGRAPLRVLVGVESNTPSMALLDWITGLCADLPCEPHLVEVVSELPALSDPERSASEAGAARAGRPRIQLRKTGDSPEWELAKIATELGADLLLVGAHQRTRLARWWRGSVADGVLHQAGTNVACVPLNWLRAGPTTETREDGTEADADRHA